MRNCARAALWRSSSAAGREHDCDRDVGDSLFAATELLISDRGEFLSPAYYTSMGFSIPAALGAATARPDHRVVVIVGDGRVSDDRARAIEFDPQEACTDHHRAR